MKHKRKEMQLEDLIVRLRIEEDNRVSERKLWNQTIESKANVVEHEINKKKRKSTVEDYSWVLKVAYPRSLKEDATCMKNQGIVQRIIANEMIKRTLTRKPSKPT